MTDRLARLLRAALPAACAAAAAVTVGAPREAGALSCAQPRVTVFPADQVAAPLNTHVVITVPPHTDHFVKPDGIAMVTATLGQRGKTEPVAVQRIDLGAGDQRQIELVPMAALRANTQYDVLLGSKDGPPKPAVVAGSFRTGGEADRLAPIWNGVEQATVAPRTNGKWGATGPTASFRYVTASDEATPTAQLRFGFWLPDAQGNFDYARPPVTWEIGFDGSTRLTGGELCGWATFKFPIVTRVGVRVADLAGNLGPPSEVRLVPVAAER